MIRGFLTSLAALLVISSSTMARAESWGDTTKDPDPSGAISREVPRTKFVFSTSVAYTETPIRIDSVDLKVPEESALGRLVEDIDASIGEMNLQSTAYQFSASYFPLRFLQLTAKAGFVSSRTSADIAVSGTVRQNILGIDSFEATLPREDENEGLTYGAGAAVFLPIFKIAERPLVMRASAEIGINNLDHVDTRTLVSNVSIANAQRIMDRDVTLAIGASYISLNREVEFATEIGGQETGVRLDQSLDTPWTASSTLLVPITDSFGVSVTAANNFDGLQSYGLNFTFRR